MGGQSLLAFYNFRPSIGPIRKQRGTLHQWYEEGKWPLFPLSYFAHLSWQVDQPCLITSMMSRSKVCRSRCFGPGDRMPPPAWRLVGINPHINSRSTQRSTEAARLHGPPRSPTYGPPLHNCPALFANEMKPATHWTSSSALWPASIPRCKRRSGSFHRIPRADLRALLGSARAPKRTRRRALERRVRRWARRRQAPLLTLQGTGGTNSKGRHGVARAPERRRTTLPSGRHALAIAPWHDAEGCLRPGRWSSPATEDLGISWSVPENGSVTADPQPGKSHVFRLATLPCNPGVDSTFCCHSFFWCKCW